MDGVEDVQVGDVFGVEAQDRCGGAQTHRHVFTAAQI
jgi:hypothetical protein